MKGKRIGRGVVGRAVTVAGFKGQFIVDDVADTAKGRLYFVRREMRGGGTVRTANYRPAVKFVRHNYEAKP